MLIETRARKPNGAYTERANQLCAEVDQFTKTLLEKYGDDFSADEIAYMIATTSHGVIVMEIAMQVVDKPTN